MSGARLTLLALFAFAAPALAWGPNGHHTVGALAGNLIAGSNAGKQVAAILGGVSLADATVWADCARGIDPARNFAYESTGKYPDCAIFENAAEEAAMADFVRRNDTNCDRKPGEESCHKQYHYTDIAIDHERYDASFAGARNDDIVAAIVAATRKLKGESVPAPFNFKDKREALLVLAHYVGDIHQPLHAGALYIDGAGTRGGNDIVVTAQSGKDSNLHAIWDAIPESLDPSHVTPAWVKQARDIPMTSGDVEVWPVAWATESVKAAQQAFKGLEFKRLPNSHWSTVLPPEYSASADQIKKTRLTQAGARLAQLLQAIWP